jgi:CrcB protein
VASLAPAQGLVADERVNAAPVGLTGRRAALIATGGALGATTRWAIQDLLGPSQLDAIPWWLVAVNAIGSALLAGAVVTARRRPERVGLLVDGVGSGFCGGLTTFSAFALTTAAQLRDGSPTWAAASVVVVLAASIGASMVAARMVPRADATPAVEP